MIRSEPTAPAAERRPRLLPRVELARVIVLAEAPMLAVIAFYFLSTQQYLAAGLAAGGAALLVWGATRIGRDAVSPRTVAGVPWDWTDFLIFWPGAFTAGQVLISLAVSITHSAASGVDPSVRTALESFVGQGAYYAGALFNLWVLVGLRRSGTLSDLGWRRFRWWWVPLAVVGAAATLEVAAFLQQVAQSAFPTLHNTQCTAVRHDYGHVIVLALIVVCVFAPLAEETIFRGFSYSLMRSRAGVPVALVASAAIFSLVHAVTLLLLPLFAVGLLLALFFQGSRSVWPGVIVHALFNLPGIISILYSASC